MAERPIIFSGAMVKAILDGRKTQTRRVVKVPGIMGGRFPITAEAECPIELNPGEFAKGVFHYQSTAALSGPYNLGYAVGDVLWVREAHAARLGDDGKPDPNPRYVKYRADPGHGKTPNDPNDWHSWPSRWTPSIHMPRWASRITLKVTGVKVERLNDISAIDAELEGVKCDMSSRTFIDHFRNLWERIHGPSSWNANPWVVSISFVPDTGPKD